MKLCLAVILLISISMANAIEMREDISVFGDGGMSAQTNTGDGKDRLNARGEQTYSRSFSIEEDSSYLETIYVCKDISRKNPKFYNNSTNYYYVSGKNSGESQHSILISSNQSIESSATVEHDGDSFSTNYVMKSRYGNLTEALTEKIGARTNYLAESEISGNLTLSSEVTEAVERWRGYEVDQLKKLNAVKTLGNPDREAEIRLELGYVKTAEQEAASLIKEGNKYANDPDTYDKALAYYDEALKKDRKSLVAAVAWNFKGRMLYNLGAYSEAIVAFDEALKINPDLKDARREKSIAQIYANKFEDALLTLDSIIEENPENAEAWYYKGGALKQMGRVNEAIAAFDKTLSLDSEYADAYFSKGDLIYGLAISKYGNNSTMLLEAKNLFVMYKAKGGELTDEADKRIETIDGMI